jgi:hypothetical protein
MGLLSNLAKIGDHVLLCREAAEREWASSSRVYAPTLAYQADFGAQVEAIENVGWVMEHWAVAKRVSLAGADHAAPVPMPLFRRPASV